MTVAPACEVTDVAAGTVDSWLLWHLSGGEAHVTDYSNASRTMLYDIRRLEWSQELLDDLDGFIAALDKAGRKAMVVVVPEHGAALRGDRMQIAGLREFATPSIATVPVIVLPTVSKMTMPV